MIFSCEVEWSEANIWSPFMRNWSHTIHNFKKYFILISNQSSWLHPLCNFSLFFLPKKTIQKLSSLVEQEGEAKHLAFFFLLFSFLCAFLFFCFIFSLSAIFKSFWALKLRSSIFGFSLFFIFTCLQHLFGRNWFISAQTGLHSIDMMIYTFMKLSI